jgi:glycosyltransferase involved in cell wall biosynthesis
MKQTSDRSSPLGQPAAGDRLALVKRVKAPDQGVLQVVLTLGPGGTERLVVQLCQRLERHFRMAVCALDEPGGWAADLALRGIDVVPLHRQPGFRPLLGQRIAALAKRYGASVVHCHHYSPFVYGSIASLLRPGLKVLYTEHGRLSDAPPSSKRRLVNPWLGRWPHATYAVSHALRTSMIAEGFPADRVRVIHNGVDPVPLISPFRRRDARTILGVTDQAFVVGTVARLDPVKDLATLIEAVARARAELPETVLAIIGDGDERERLMAAAAQLGVSDAVRFVGHRDDARQLLSGLDVYVNSSVSEGISLTILEAMAAGVPVVATQVGGTPEIVTDGQSGILVPPRNPSAIAGALQTLAARADQRLRLGLEGQQVVGRQFTIDRMVEQYAEEYRRLSQ